MKHVMVDLETLGTVADAVIMSIGAVKFDLDSDALDNEGFYASVSIDSNLALGRRIQEDTLIWWMDQSRDAQAVFHEQKTTLEEALRDFSDWIGTDRCYMWSNGADFDLPMVCHAMAQLDIQPPWKFWDNRCFRTFKNLPHARLVTFTPTQGVKHNALDDAINQARHAQLIQAALLGAIPKAPAMAHPMVKAVTQ